MDDSDVKCFEIREDIVDDKNIITLGLRNFISNEEIQVSTNIKVSELVIIDSILVKIYHWINGDRDCYPDDEKYESSIDVEQKYYYTLTYSPDSNTHLIIKMDNATDTEIYRFYLYESEIDRTIRKINRFIISWMMSFD